MSNNRVGQMNYYKAMKVLEHTMHEISPKVTGGHTPVKDMLFFERIKLDQTALWYSGKIDNFKFIVMGVADE